MALNKQDCLLLLTELQENGIEVQDKINELLTNKEQLPKIISFININKQLDATKFYEKLRKSYNDKKSKLYINIVKEEIENPKDILITLASLQLQILLYTKNVEDVSLFLRSLRFDEINKCFIHYSKTKDIVPSQKLLHLFKCDLKCLDLRQSELNS